MAEFKLWCFGESGNSYKAALMLNLCDLEWRPELVDFFNGETRGDAYRSDVNEMGEAPVLDHNGKMLSQSGVILDYLSSLTGKFSGRDADERREILRWILWDNHKFTSYIATLRFLVTLAKTGDPAVIEWLRGRVNGSMGVLDKHLAGRAFLLGDRPTIADISLVGYLYYGDELPFEVLPHVTAWTERVKALPHWKHPYDLMPRKAKA
ncbi:glutathione S-transferase family protein [Aestuariivirga litoralis]|uniref:glutathione S-transferase family protein n=1 Tax=Aestuariivirga litoralis TaxID=2650924 RepID=UPI0018C72594|nr:glutathione S-transferase family protein [Aestuariivirga litoralis]MBG1232284.1 glutathione S-transferase family protein [Aestuariivirga litoralis]